MSLYGMYRTDLEFAREDIEKKKRETENNNTEIRDYKRRIDKAINYIKNNALYKEDWVNVYDEAQYCGSDDSKAKEDLINILIGK